MPKFEVRLGNGVNRVGGWNKHGQMPVAPGRGIRAVGRVGVGIFVVFVRGLPMDCLVVGCFLLAERLLAEGHLAEGYLAEGCLAEREGFVVLI